MRKYYKNFIRQGFILKVAIHTGVLSTFIIASLIFYFPLLQGKTLIQSDIVQYQGMSRQLKEYRQSHQLETYWVDNAFVGMPTYQLGAKYPMDILEPGYQLIRLLPRPAHILFLYLASMYLLLLVLNINWRYAFLGSFAFGFSTYLLIILQVGHNTKALAIGYIPLVIAGLILLFQKRWLIGFILTTIALGLQIRSNHYQMTYYLLFLMGICFVYNAIVIIKKGGYNQMLKTVGIMGLSGIIAIGFNSTSLLATSEYSSFSTRGKSELRFTPDNQPKEVSSGLDYDYITEYSYGLFESFNLIFPRIQGGGSRENLRTNSNFYQFLIQNGVDSATANQAIKAVPTYWGNQPILEAPAYIGITIFFLTILGLFIFIGPLQVWLCIAVLFSLFLSWGKNFPIMTDLFIDFVPFYNKFRAVSSIQIILQICFPILAMLGLHHYSKALPKVKIASLLRALYVVGGVIVLLYLSKGFHSFESLNDAFYRQSYGDNFVESLKADRKRLYNADLLRGFIFIGSLCIVLLYSHVKKIRWSNTLILVGLIVVIDLISISNRYIDRNLFIDKQIDKSYFEMTSSDKFILQDTTRFRVYNLQSGLVGARDAFFHNSLGGYHAAKPRKIQDLYDYNILNGNNDVFSMLNVKYFIYPDNQSGELMSQENTEVFGNAWFIEKIELVEDYDLMLKRLDSLDLEHTALIIENQLTPEIPLKFTRDSLSKIELVKYRPNYLKYHSISDIEQFVVFSEMYYPHGWKLTINGQPAPIYNVNYLLRGVYLPKGENLIEFRFEPQVIQAGTRLTVISLVLFLSIVLSFVIFSWRRSVLGFSK